MKIENILRSVVLGGAFLVLLTPLIVVGDMFFPYITGKAFYFRIVVEIMAAAWLGLLYINPIYRPKKSLIIALVGVFLAIIALADIFGTNTFASLWSNYERMEGFVGLAHVALYFVIIATTLSTEKLWERFFQASILVGVIVNFMALKEFATAEGAVRLAASLGNPTYLAVYTLVHAFLAAFLLVRTSIKWEKVGYVMIGLLNVFVLYYTATRGALLGLIAGVMLAAILIAFFGKSKHPQAWKFSVGAIATIVILIGGFLSIKNTEFVQNSPVLSRFASISLEEQTTRSRFMVWNMAWQGFKERPVLGWGQENFLEVFNKYYNPKMYNQEPWFDRAHNVFFDWLVAGGFLGLLGYLALFAAAAFVLWRRTSFSVVEKSILTGLFGGYFVHNLFVFDHLVSYILFFGLLGFLAHHERTDYIKEHKGSKYKNPAHVSLVVSVIVIVVIVGGYLLNQRGLIGNITLLKGLKYQSQQNWENSLNSFKSAIKDTSRGLGEVEVREHLTRATIGALSSTPPASQEIQNEMVSLTLDELKKETERMPNNIMPHLFLGTFLQQIGKVDDGIVELKKAQELSPRKQDILLQLGSAYLDKADYSTALDLFKEAYELEPAYSQAQKGYAVAAIYAGKEQIAKDLYGGELPAEPSFADAYVTKKQYGKAVSLWEKIVQENPDNYQYRLYLGANYLTIGRSDLAMQQLDKAAEINPEVKDQVEYYLQQIKSGNVTF